MKTLNKISTLVLVSMLLLLVAMNFAIAQDPSPVVSDADFFQLLISSLGGLKGAKVITIIAVAVKLILTLLDTPLFGKLFSKLDPNIKLAVVLFLSLISGVVGLMASGVSLGAALIHSSTMAAFLVLFNEIYKHFLKSKIEAYLAKKASQLK